MAWKGIDAHLRDLRRLGSAKVHRGRLETLLACGEGIVEAHGFWRACRIEFGDLSTEALRYDSSGIAPWDEHSNSGEARDSYHVAAVACR